MEWKTAVCDGAVELERLLCYVRRVRNNLFHGGKFWAGYEWERDQELVDASIRVLHACLSLDDRVRDFYYGGYRAR
jgi:hypothetical protein